jgi:cell division septal protein FtsQ
MKNRLIYAALLTVIVLLFSLPYFSIQHIDFDEMTYLSEKDLKAELSHLKGRNVFLTLIFRPYRKLFKTYKQIESLEKDVHFPNAITFKVIEKKPWLSCMTEGQTILISSDGIILTRGGDYVIENPNQMMVLKGMSLEYFADDHISGHLLTQLKRLNNLRTTYFPNQSVLIEQDAYNSWTLILFDQILVKLGNLDDLEEKFSRLHTFLNMIETENYSTINYIDLRIKNKLLVSKSVENKILENKLPENKLPENKLMENKLMESE